MRPRFRAPAALAGVAPIPASSGQVRRMRLDRGGKRRRKRALNTIGTVRASRDPSAKDYLARKTANQESDREALQALKRPLVRTVFRLFREGAPVLEMAARQNRSLIHSLSVLAPA